MKRVLLLGATGQLGSVLTELLIEKNVSVTALVRNPDKVRQTNHHLTVKMGDVTNTADLTDSLAGCEGVISTLGHGFRTAYPLQKKTLNSLIPLMERHRILRFITVTGAGLQVKGDPKSLIGTASSLLLPLIDPYRFHDAQNQQVLLEKSLLDWTVVRTPIHNDSTDQKIQSVGYKQPLPWHTLSRRAISQFIIRCLEDKTWIKKSPIIY